MPRKMLNDTGKMKVTLSASVTFDCMALVNDFAKRRGCLKSEAVEALIRSGEEWFEAKQKAMEVIPDEGV